MKASTRRTNNFVILVRSFETHFKGQISYLPSRSARNCQSAALDHDGDA